MDSGNPDYAIPPPMLDMFLANEEDFIQASNFSRLLGGTSGYKLYKHRYMRDLTNAFFLDGSSVNLRDNFLNSWKAALTDLGFYLETTFALGEGLLVKGSFARTPNNIGVQGEVGKYKELRKLTKNTELTPNHQPSVIALQEDFERTYGRKPTAEEKSQIINNGNCVIISRCSHLKSSETFGGRNRTIGDDGRGKYEQDADDFDDAIDSNMDALTDSLINTDGWSQKQIDIAIKKLKEANIK